MSGHKVSYASNLLALNFLRPPTVLAFDGDHTPRIGNQPHLNNGATPAHHREQNKTAENALGGGCTKLRKGIQVRNHPVGNRGIGANKSPQFINVGHDLLSLRFAPVQAKVDLAVEVSADDSTSGNDKHGHERHATVDRAKPEVRMPQDQHGSEDAKDHVGAEPEGDRPNHSQRSDAFSQRVQEQEQHEAASGNPEPIADTTDGRQAAVVTVEPADPERESDNGTKNLGNNIWPSMPTFASRICSCRRRRAGDRYARLAAGWERNRLVVIRPPRRGEILG